MGTRKGNIDMARNKVFPQCGIITVLDVSGRRAKVYLPIWKLETNYISISRIIPIKQDGVEIGIVNGSQVVISFMDGALDDGIVTGWI
jgi:hypothetical protein